MTKRFIRHRHLQRHDHGKRPHNSRDSSLPILVEASDNLRADPEFLPVADTVDHAQDPRVGHKIIYVAAVQKLMAKGQYPVIINGGDRTDSRHGKIPVSQRRADGRPRLQRSVVGGRIAAAAQAIRRDDVKPHRVELFLEHKPRFLIEAAHKDRRA